MKLSARFPAKLTSFGVKELLELVGHSLVILGVLGLLITVVYGSQSGASLRYSLSIAGIWMGGWLAMFRIPPAIFTAAWCLAGSVLWLAWH